MIHATTIYEVFSYKIDLLGLLPKRGHKESGILPGTLLVSTQFQFRCDIVDGTVMTGGSIPFSVMND